ncbi:MAG: ABC transporter substrate-binding protein [Deltaproteobacteria bacterium]|nr:ABC transporter substrate-binding protein [Deltaproteobacteria bacterium]
MPIKRFFSALLMAVGIISAVSCPSFAADKIRIGVSNLNITFLPAAVAAKKGFFRDEDLEAEIIRISAPVAVVSLVSGDLDYAMVLGSSVRAALRGLPIKVLGCFIDALAFALITQPGIRSPQDVKGKTLGVSTFGSSSDVSARIMLKHYGVDPERDVKILAVGRDSALLAALKQKLIDVAVVSPPADAEGKKMGFHIVARAYDIFRYPAIGLAANEKKISEHPNEATRTLKALIRANRYMREDRAGTIQVLTEWAKVDPASAAAAYDGSVAVFNSADGSIPEDGFRLVIQQAKKELKITREVEITEVSNLSILREAQKQLGLKGR